jgi:hypothetical protein
MKRTSMFLVVALAAGCQKPAPPTPAPGTTPAGTQPAAKDEGHAHGNGPHGGTIADWGGGKYHVEFTVDHDKKEATVYVLGGDAKTPAPIKAEKITLSINDPAFQADLKAAPQEGEKDGASSRFVGNHDNLGIVKEYAGSITGEIEGTPYAGDFKELP